jgi:hypothetical protein
VFRHIHGRRRRRIFGWRRLGRPNTFFDLQYFIGTNADEVHEIPSQRVSVKTLFARYQGVHQQKQEKRNGQAGAGGDYKAHSQPPLV